MTDIAQDRPEEFRYTVAPGIFSPLVLRTVPNAVCTVRPLEGADPLTRLKAYADPTGIVRLHVRPRGESGDVIKLVIDCEANGRMTQHPLQLRGHFEPTREMPAPPAEDLHVFRDATASIRPALSDDELHRLSIEELLERGYPLRPNGDETPRALHAWRRHVSEPMIAIKPHLVRRDDAHGGKPIITEAPLTSSNWCGFELRRTLLVGGVLGGGPIFDDPYDWVEGTWNVPATTGETNRPAQCSVWVGLDGVGTPDLVQAGTNSNSIFVIQQSSSSAVLNVGMDVSTYWAWTEFLPQQQTSVDITNFPVNPGDLMLVQVWIGNAGSTPTLSGAFGVFLLMNLTQRVSTAVYTPVAPTVVGGSDAVWIVERPLVNFQPSGIFGAYSALADLANFGSAVMSNAFARKANRARGQGYVSYFGSRIRQYNMTNGGNTLSTVTAIDSSSMRFDWKGFA